MTRRRGAAWLGAACALLSARALALDLTAAPPEPVPVGESRTFRIASVADAEGAVTYRWNFGDGTVVGPGAGAEVEHLYASAGHYTVIVVGTDASGQRTSTSWIQTAHTPLTDPSPSNSGSVVFDAERRRIWSVNPDSRSVSVTGSDSLEQELELVVGDQPRALAQAPSGALWVTLQRADAIAVLDPDDGTELAREVAVHEQVTVVAEG
ncbi:MAG TPA: PKD domain-containing protein, partial [Polyangiaceae bacterium]|nr:PKD domain-containing protein [Polyangiaceae bacterium]